MASKKDKGGKDIVKGLKKNPALAIVLAIVAVAVVYIIASNNNNNPSGSNAQGSPGLSGIGGAYILQGEGVPNIVNNYPQSLHTKKHHVTAHGGHEKGGHGKKTKPGAGGTTHSHGGTTHTHIGGHTKHSHTSIKG